MHPGTNKIVSGLELHDELVSFHWIEDDSLRYVNSRSLAVPRASISAHLLSWKIRLFHHRSKCRVQIRHDMVFVRTIRPKDAPSTLSPHRHMCWQLIGPAIETFLQIYNQLTLDFAFDSFVAKVCVIRTEADLYVLWWNTIYGASGHPRQQISVSLLTFLI